MKLATLKDGSRDGLLAIVSRDLSQAHFAVGIATRLQQVLDDWNFLSPQLEDLSAALNSGRARHAFAFDASQCMAPLPRAYARVDAAAFASHAKRLGHAPSSTGIRLAPRRGDGLLGACDDVLFAALAPHAADEEAAADAGAIDAEGAAETDPAQALCADFGAGLAAVTGDIARGCNTSAALEGVRLLMLACDFRLRAPSRGEPDMSADPATGFVVTAFAPVALTPDELGPAWRAGRVHLDLLSKLNGRQLGRFAAGPAMQTHFGALVRELAALRGVQAGTLVGSGTASTEEAERGSACIAERRALEALRDGAPHTPWLSDGDRVRVELLDSHGQAPFGTIDAGVRFAGVRAPAAALAA